MQAYWITRANVALMAPSNAPAVEAFFAVDLHYPATAPEYRAWRQLPRPLAMALFLRILTYCRYQHEELSEERTWELTEAFNELQLFDLEHGLFDWQQIGKDLAQAVPGFNRRYLMIRKQNLDPREVSTRIAS